MVMTTAQSKREKMAEEAWAEKEEISGAKPSPIEEVEQRTGENDSFHANQVCPLPSPGHTDASPTSSASLSTVVSTPLSEKALLKSCFQTLPLSLLCQYPPPPLLVDGFLEYYLGRTSAFAGDR